MKITEEFSVEKVDDTTYKGGMSVRVGPVSANYKGTVSFELDEATRSATVHAKGRGAAGMGGADMRMNSRITEVAENETKVTVDADVAISGVLAQFGRGMIEQVSKKMFKEFTAAVKAELEPD
jgi:carbon monoxide dehydrogenase subunit G